MSRLKGISVTLTTTTQNGVDGFNRPIYTESSAIIDNVLVSPASAQEVVDSLNLEGKKAVYTLAIPKGDTHDWKNKKVQFFGQTFKTFGEPTKGIDDLIPLDWNMKVMVGIYE